MTILEAMDDPQLFGRWFRGDSWRAWRVFLAALFGSPIAEQDLAIYSAATGRTAPFTAAPSEGWACCGRRAGKSLIAALVAVYCACFRDYAPHLAPGEVATVMLIAADRKQARVVLRFIRAFLHDTPILAPLVIRETKESIELSNRVSIEVHTASFRSVRGYTLAAVINDEIAFWQVEDAAQPDKEILAAERPALTTIPGALMLGISSPYARRGTLYSAFALHFGRDDSPVLFWKAPSRSLDPDSAVEMNPLLDIEIVRAAYDEDPIAAASEWGADFRSDVERMFSLELLDSVTDRDRPEILPYTEEELAS